MSYIGMYSELEYMVLGMIDQGHASGYAIRKELQKTRGTRWSAESGSVYRVLRRLETDDLVVQKGKAGLPNRERLEYGLTERGEGLLVAWLSFPPDRSEFSGLIDPIRTRCQYLGKLKEADQVRVLKAWVQESKLLQTELARELRATEDHTFERAAVENLIALAHARHEWLKNLLAAVRHGWTVPNEVEPREVV